MESRAEAVKSSIQQGHSSPHTGFVTSVHSDSHPSAFPGTYKLLQVSTWSSAYWVRGFPKGEGREGTPPWDTLRLGHYGCGFKTLIKPYICPSWAWTNANPNPSAPSFLEKPAHLHPQLAACRAFGKEPSPTHPLQAGALAGALSLMRTPWPCLSILSNDTGPGPCFFRGNSPRK